MLVYTAATVHTGSLFAALKTESLEFIEPRGRLYVYLIFCLFSFLFRIHSTSSIQGARRSLISIIHTHHPVIPEMLRHGVG
jgi:hypothetical protein